MKHASDIGNWFKKNTPRKILIYSSPIKRCVQTSKQIALETSSQIVLDERLIETRCPNLEGKVQASHAEWKVQQNDPSRESKEEILRRITDIFEEKIRNNADCILVSHGDPTTILLYHLKKKKVPKYLWSPKYSDTVVKKGDIYKISVKKNKVTSITKVVPDQVH